MSRMEFMAKLAELLQDISREERTAAIQYYNDYFDDAGEGGEEAVMKELGSPGRVAGEVKAGLREAAADVFESRENGYADTRFESREVPSAKASEPPKDPRLEGNASRTRKLLLVVLIILAVIFGFPAGLAGLGTVMTAFGVLAGFVALCAAAVIIGACLVAGGVVALIPSFPVGLVMIGAGLMTGVLGVLGGVGCICGIAALPKLIRSIVGALRRLFHKKKEA